MTPEIRQLRELRHVTWNKAEALLQNRVLTAAEYFLLRNLLAQLSDCDIRLAAYLRPGEANVGIRGGKPYLVIVPWKPDGTA